MYNRVSNQPRDNVINVILIKKITKTATVLPIREFRLLLENFFWPCLEVGAEEAEEVEEAEEEAQQLCYLREGEMICGMGWLCRAYRFVRIELGETNLEMNQAKFWRTNIVQ